MPVLVLQALTIESRPSGRSANKETLTLHITRSPGEITDALETEHGVVNIKWNHGQAIGAVRAARRHPGRERTGFVNAFLKDAAFLILAVVHHLPLIDRLVKLAFR